MISDKPWRFNYTIPVWGIVAAVGQGLFWGIFIYFTFYTSQMNLERRVSLLENGSAKSETFVRLDEKMNSVKEDIGSLKTDIKNVNEEIRKLGFKGR